MNYIFNDIYIKGNELLFWIYVASIILMLLLTLLFVKKELGKRK